MAVVGFHAQALCSEGFYPGSRRKQRACCADQSHLASPFLLLLPVRALVIMSQKMSSWPRAPGAGWG